MNQDKMHLVNKLFQNERIRTVWDNEQEKYYISVVDIVRVLTKSTNPRHYWNVLKGRLRNEGNETVTNCDQLKLVAQDGKYRMTDVVDIEGMFRIIESIPGKNAEPIKQWLAHLGKERIDEVYDPSITIQRAIDTYQKKGYPEDWIIKRIKGIQDRKKLTDTWNDHGVYTEQEYAILTNEIYKEWSGMTAKEYKDYKGLRKESLRDNMTDIEVALSDLGELATREIAKKKKPKDLNENMDIARRGGKIAANTRKDLENEIGEDVVTNNNYLNYEYLKNKGIETSYKN